MRCRCDGLAGEDSRLGSGDANAGEAAWCAGYVRGLFWGMCVDLGGAEDSGSEGGCVARVEFEDDVAEPGWCEEPPASAMAGRVVLQAVQAAGCYVVLTQRRGLGGRMAAGLAG